MAFSLSRDKGLIGSYIPRGHDSEVAPHIPPCFVCWSIIRPSCIIRYLCLLMVPYINNTDHARIVYALFSSILFHMYMRHSWLRNLPSHTALLAVLRSGDAVLSIWTNVRPNNSKHFCVSSLSWPPIKLSMDDVYLANLCISFHVGSVQQSYCPLDLFSNKGTYVLFLQRFDFF